MRWRAFYFEKCLFNELPNNSIKRNNGFLNDCKLSVVGRLPFTTNKCAPVCPKILCFELELFDLVNSIGFKHSIYNFQINQRNQINSVKNKINH